MFSTVIVTKLLRKEEMRKQGCCFGTVLKSHRGISLKSQIMALEFSKTLVFLFFLFFFFAAVAQASNSGFGCLIVEISRSHTIRHTHTR